MVGSLDELSGLACQDGVGTVSVTYGTDGSIDLRCVPDAAPPGGCGSLVAFDPRSTQAYDDLAVVDESLADQYRSFADPAVVSAVQAAAERVRTMGAGWASGHGAPIGLGDMSECDGSIPGTSRGEPGHPAGTHEDGLDIDVAYFQNATPDNHLRPVCESTEAGREVSHCTGDPVLLDGPRTALFLESLASSGLVRVVGVDGRIGPVLVDALEDLCNAGISRCTPVPLDYEPVDEGRGWFHFHHHHMHISFELPGR